MLEGVDVSWVQGNYRPGAEDFVIVNTSRANVGLAVGSMYRTQVANARAAGKHVGHYFFNGNVDPVRCADFFVDNLSYVAGDSLWLDVEAEPSTGTAAWSVGQAHAFLSRVQSRLGVVPGVYLNKSLMDGANWSSVVQLGAPLWIAYYNASPPPIRWWPSWTMWQYTSTPIDRNRAQAGLTAALSAMSLVETKPEIDVKSSYLIKGAVGPDMEGLNGILAVIGPNLFTAIGSEGDFDGIVRDLEEDKASVLDGYNPVGSGVQRTEFVRLVTIFGIEPLYVGPGGRYYGPGHPLNTPASPGL